MDVSGISVAMELLTGHDKEVGLYSGHTEGGYMLLIESQTPLVHCTAFVTLGSFKAK